MARIFISYSRSDRSFVEQFVAHVSAIYKDNRFWYDNDIPGGADWWKTIIDEIRRCNLFIYMVSDASLASSYCQDELREAVRLKKSILPVIIQPLSSQYPGNTTDELVNVLSKIHYVDMSSGFNNLNANARLYAALNKFLDVKPKRNVGAVALGGIASFVTLILILLVINQEIQPNPPETPSQAADMTEEIPQSVTDDPATSAATAEATEVDNADLSPIELAQRGVTSNDEWTPYYEVFGQTSMVLVPFGCFTLGSEDGDSDTSPTDYMCIDNPFWIDKYETTNGEYTAFVAERGNESLDGFKYIDVDSPNSRIQFNGTSWYVISGYEQHPVTLVTWFAARDYCAWRDGRLPTEPEWEYAASGPDNLEYPWGNSWNAINVVWLDNRSVATNTNVVGSKINGVSWVGALDMSGNVWEWVNSLFRQYPYGISHEDAENFTDWRTMRGNSWESDNPLDFGTSERIGNYPRSAFYNAGFRCARDFDPNE